jgi:hypothetical protein
MLLLTSLAFGGSESLAAFEHLSPDEEELLKHRAQNLLQIPREKRIPLVIQEIKRIVTARRRQLANADPKRLAALLSKERAALTEVVLRALPSELAEACRVELGARSAIKLSREVRGDILSIVRWKLEAGLKRGAPQVGSFRFTDLLTMSPREVLSICDRMGARVLATAVAGLGEASREEFLSKLPPDQRALALKAAEAGKTKRLSEADSKTVLEIHGALENPSVGMRSAGAQRVVRAALAQGSDFAARLFERHAGGELGKLIMRWVKEEKTKPIKADGGRLDIVEQMERLAQRGVIDRPLRLPPPARPPSAPPAPAPLYQPFPRRVAHSQSGPGPEAPKRREDQRPASPRAAPLGAGMVPRRDPIAERNARRAGVASARIPGPHKSADGAASGGKRIMKDANASEKPAEPSSGSRRIMRDGKPLAREGNEAPIRPRRAVPSPTMQELPKRRERGTEKTDPSHSKSVPGDSQDPPENA